MQPKNLKVQIEKTLSKRPDLDRLLRDHGIGSDQLAELAAEPLDLAQPTKVRSIIVGGAPVPATIVQAAESIISLTDRPPLLVSGDDFEIPSDPETAARLKSARGLIVPRLRSVGRVEVFDGFTKYPVGTAWIIAENVAITNRHVAEKFVERTGGTQAVLQKDLRGRSFKVVIDFREEHGSTIENEIEVAEVLYLAPAASTAADLALLKLSPNPQMPRPIPLLAGTIKTKSWVAVIGYPQADERLPHEARAVEESYFSNIYGVKRLSPGEIDAHDVSGAPAWLIAHDATTLGGNSGSVLLDLETGGAAGIHFMGHYRKANYAVSSAEIKRILDELGIAAIEARAAAAASSWNNLTADAAEAPESLDAYQGYISNFIEPGGAPEFEVPLPDVQAHAPGRPAHVDDGGIVLRYRNFSVVMNASRRLCFFSAVNIDGSASFAIKGNRPRWRPDRRLHDSLQIIDECYGLESDGKFSRGHMTRREDPNWGSSRADAIISNRHTFYVTNACPQFQPFNAGVWLSLEDYALDNCKADEMRVSVFTGPVFRDDDPVYFGVNVPVTFWKIIAFKHDETGALTATGYTMSQKDVLPTAEEFVYGQFRNRQVTIRSIERLSGISFGHLRDHDPFDDGTEGIAFQPLRTPADIRFR